MITTLIFDWGGVFTIGRHTDSIIRIIEKKHNLENIFPIIDNLMVSIDSGKISFEEFCKYVNKEFGTNISVKEMKNIFDEAIISNNEMIELVKKLKEKYRLIFLSNNNKPTIEILKTKHKKMLDLFEKLYFSVELKMRKPSKELFKYVIKDADLKPEECLFIDDKEKSINGAKEVGIKGILFDNIDQFKKELASFGISTS